MSSTVRGRINAALAAVVFLIVAVGFLGTMYWMGSATASADENSLIAQATSCPAPEKAATEQAKPADSRSKETGDKDKPPPIGICRQDWIEGWDTPTYNCSVLLGPA